LKEGDKVELFKLFGSIFIENSEANQALDDTEQKAGKTSGTFGMMGGAAAALGGVLAGALVAGAGAAVAGLGGLFVMGDNLKESLNKLQMQTGASAEEMESMEESLKTIYKNGYGDSFQEISDTMALAKQSTTALGEELMFLTQDSLMLRDTFGIEMSESLRAAETMMNQFGSTGTEAMAFIAEATQKGLNQNEDLVDTIEEYSVYFKTAGLDAQDMFGILENASKAGVRNLDFVGDAFKEMVIRTKDGSKATTEAYQSLGLNAKQMTDDFAAGGERGKQAYQTMIDALNKIEDPVKKNTVGVQLFGTKFEDLEAGAIAAMANLDGTIEGSVDTLNTINEIKYDSFGAALSGIGRNLMMGVFEPFQEKVMPIVNQFANWMAEKMPVVEEITNKTFTAIFDAVGVVWAFFKDNILPIFTEMFNNVQSNWPLIKETISTVFNAVWEVAKTVWNFFKDNILPIFISLYEWISGHMPTIRATVETVFNKIVEVVSKVWAFFKDNILPILERLFEFIQSKMPQIRSIVETAFNIIANVVRIVWDIFENILLPVLKKLWDWVSPYIPKVQKIIEDAFSAIFDAVDVVVGVFDDVVSAVRDAIDWLTFWDNKKVSKKTIEVEERRTTSGNQIPGNATGTGFFQGGLSLVGERGPELVELPRGTKITPANATRNKLSKQETKQPAIIQVVTPDKRTLAEWLVDDITEYQELNLDRKLAFGRG
jgi:phage-related minor tail protein